MKLESEIPFEDFLSQLPRELVENVGKPVVLDVKEEKEDDKEEEKTGDKEPEKKVVDMKVTENQSQSADVSFLNRIFIVFNSFTNL